MIKDFEENVKVGIAANPEKRLKQLQTGHPQKLEIYYKEEFDCKRNHILKIENKLHNDLSIRFPKLQGEWFKVKEEELETVKNVVIFFRIRYENDTISFNRMFR